MKPVIRQRDPVRYCMHGRTEIAEGANLPRIDGRPAMLHGHRGTCECTRVSSMSDTRVAF